MKEIVQVESAPQGYYEFNIGEKGSTLHRSVVDNEILPQTNSILRSANEEMYDWLMTNTRGEIAAHMVGIAVDPHTFEPVIRMVLYLEDESDATAFALRW